MIPFGGKASFGDNEVLIGLKGTVGLTLLTILLTSSNLECATVVAGATILGLGATIGGLGFRMIGEILLWTGGGSTGEILSTGLCSKVAGSVCGCFKGDCDSFKGDWGSSDTRVAVWLSGSGEVSDTEKNSSSSSSDFIELEGNAVLF